MAHVTIAYALAEDRMEAVMPKFIIPDIFNPASDEIEDFIKQYEKCAAANGWNIAHRIRYCGRFLKGMAYYWYDRYINMPEHRNKTWDEIKYDMVLKFSWNNSTTAKEERLNALKQGDTEGIREYYCRVYEVLEECGKLVNDRNVQFYFELGLHDEYRKWYDLIACQRMTEDDLKGIAYRLEKHNMLKGLKSPCLSLSGGEPDKVPKTRDRCQNIAPSQDEYCSQVRENIMQYNNQRSDDAAQILSRQHGKFRTADGRPKCFFCRRPGHVRKYCKKLRLDRGYKYSKFSNRHGSDARVQESQHPIDFQRKKQDSYRNIKHMEHNHPRQQPYWHWTDRTVNRKPICFKCRRLGHIRRNCYFSKDISRSRMRKQNFRNMEQPRHYENKFASIRYHENNPWVFRIIDPVQNPDLNKSHDTVLASSPDFLDRSRPTSPDSPYYACTMSPNVKYF